MLTLQFCLLLKAPPTPPPAHTPAQIHWELKWPSGKRKWHTCINSHLSLLRHFHKSINILYFAKPAPFYWNLDFFLVHSQSCYISCCHIGFIFVCVGTSPSPVCPINTVPVRSMGKWAKNMNLKEPSITIQSRTVWTKGWRQKKEKHFSSHTPLRWPFRCVKFRGIEADRPLRTQWGSYNLLWE